MRLLDVVLLAAVLPVFLIAGLPLLGWLAAAGVWTVNRLIQAWAERRAAASGDLRTVAGVMVGSTIGRAWIIALTLFAVGVGDHEVGLAAAVLIIVLVTIYLPLHALDRRGGP